jgi:UDP-N-acetylmuramate dehydrogenase
LEGLFLDKENERVLKLNGGDLNFSYRSSVIKYENLIFLKGKLRGSFDKKENVLEQFCAFTKTRHNTQPKEYSLGSFFKRGKDYYSSKLIDEAGLRGFSVGGASVSEKHAGFIINRGFATASDINELAEIIEKKIYQNYSIMLEREAEFVL